MPQIMAEAFARGLIDKIMVEVLDHVIDHDAQAEKCWGQHVDGEIGDDRSPQASAREGFQAHEQRMHVNYNKVEEMELIAKIVRDLRDIQIGDSRYVLPPSLLALEKQVKCGTCNIDGALPLADASDVAETRTTQGQGDTHHQTTIRATTLEPSIDSTKPTEAIRQEKERIAGEEATSVSVGLLHQLIEEMKCAETVPTRSKDEAAAANNEERVATWEEKEEELIRTIDGTGHVLETTEELPPRRSESTGRFRSAVEPKRIDELRSRSNQHVAGTPREVARLEGIERSESSPLSQSLKPPRDSSAISMEEIVPADDAATGKTPDAKKRKKSGLAGRLRRFFRAAFGRRKN